MASRAQNGASDAIRAALAKATRPMSIAEVIEAIDTTHPNAQPNNVGALLRQMHERGELVRFGPPRRYDYALAGSDAAKAGATAAAPGSLPAAPVASLGASAARTERAPSRPDRLEDRVLAVLTRFDLTVDELHAELARGADEAVSRSDVLAALRELAARGQVRVERLADGTTCYGVLEEAPTAEQAKPADQDADAGAFLAACEALARLDAAFPATGTSRPESARADALGLGARLRVVADDVHDAVVEACERCLPHAVIRALAEAARAMARASRAVVE